MRRIQVLIVALLMGLVAPSTLQAACLCGIISSPGEVRVRRTWSERDRIFIGEVLDADTMPGGRRKAARFLTLESWRGAMPDTVTLLIGDDAGCVYYTAGGRYIVHADLASPDATTLVTSQCDGSLSADHAVALKRIADLGPASWRAPPMGSRKLDAVAIRIGEQAPGDSSDAHITFVMPLHPFDSVARFQIAQYDWPHNRRNPVLHLPPGLYQFRMTWKDGTTYASYVSLRCGRRPSGDRCQVFRRYLKPKPAVCPPPRGAPFLSCQVDSPPALLPGRAIPRFPETLRKQGASGAVRVRYTVDTTGRMSMATLVIGQPTHEHFEITVRNTLPSSRFVPGTLAGARVPVRVEEVFVFNSPGTYVLPIRAVFDTTSDGAPRTTLSGPLRDSLAGAAMSARDLVEAQWSAVATVLPSREEVAAQLSVRSIPAVCVTVLRAGDAAEAHAERLRQTSSPTRKVVDAKSCPRTYASPQVVVDSLGRRLNPVPSGSADPAFVRVTRAEPWSGDAVLIDASVGQGVGGRTYQCGAERVGTRWRATCLRGASYSH